MEKTYDHTSELSLDKKADLWVQHNLLMWRSVYATPIIGATIFAGWYALINNNQPFLAKAILVTGIVVMAIQWLIIRRMAQYTVALLKAIGIQVAEIPSPPMGLNGVTVAMGVPIVISALFGLMLIFGATVISN